jgi:Amino acid synthesis
MPLDIRKLVVHLEEVRAEGGRGDAGGPLRKVAALAVVPNPYAGRPWSGGLDGEQEHANACITGVFGDALREAVGGGKAWLPSVTKRVPAGAAVDIPVCYRDAIWVRSHYDAVTVAVPDAPLAGELVVGLALTNRGRLNARLGGLAKEEVVGQDGLR